MKQYLVPLLSVGVLGAGYLVLQETRSGPSTTTFEFAATADTAPFSFDEFAYQNPKGDQNFRFRDVRFYVSNIEIAYKDQVYSPADSYHLIQYDANTPVSSISIADIPMKKIDRVTLSIGLDETANSSIEPRGDLDPNSRMAWNWNIGYKFLLAEGNIDLNGTLAPLVYHVGFSENRREIDFEFAEPIKLSSDVPIAFDVDILKLFNGTSQIDMATLQTVKMDKTDAALLADNYAQMISLKSAE